MKSPRQFVTFLLFGLMICNAFESSGQMRILPREKLDSMITARQKAENGWAEDFLGFDSLVFDAGTVSVEADPIKAEFRFVNRGEEALHFPSVATSCSCVSAVVEPAFVQPGDTAVVKAVYVQRGHVGRHPRILNLVPSGVSESPVAVLVIRSLVTE